MKAVLLAAGFGTRLERDLLADTSGNYHHLNDVPKPLLPIGKKPLASYWADTLHNISSIDEIYVVTNGYNYDKFQQWAKDQKDVKLFCDGCKSNNERTGAVGDMYLTMQQFEVDDDVIFIAGDTLFHDDFDLEVILKKFQEFKSHDADANMLLYVTCTDDEVHKYGILETDANFRVTGFLEKPQAHETSSRKECPCFYFLNKSAIPLLGQFLEEKKDEPLKARDATGNFIAYLYPRLPVYATEISGRFDVGGLQSYITCHEYFLRKAIVQNSNVLSK